MQRAGVGVAFLPSRLQSALNQACSGKGEPRASGSVACLVCQDRGEPGTHRTELPPAGEAAGPGWPSSGA